MNDQTLKSLAGFLVENKDRISRYLDYFQASDLRNGVLSIPEALINGECKDLILPKLSPYLKDYKISFSSNYIFLDLNLSIKQLGMLKAMYLLELQEFVFEPQSHRISFAYREDIRSQGNPMQGMMLKTFLLNQGTLLQKAVGLSKWDAITATRSHVTIDLNQIPVFSSALFEKVRIEFCQCQDGKFTCNYTFLD